MAFRGSTTNKFLFIVSPQNAIQGHQNFHPGCVIHSFNFINNQRRQRSTCADPSSPTKGKVAIITGGARGIGLCIAEQLLQAEAEAVILGDVLIPEMEEATANLNDKFGEHKALFQPTDVTKAKQMEKLFKCTKERFGKVDIVINNAGILSNQNFEQSIGVNIKGLVRGTFLAFQYMQGNGGIIINNASVDGFQSFYAAPVYCGTNHFIIGFTRSMGHDYFYKTTKVKVMAFCPAPTDTLLLKNASKNGDDPIFPNMGQQLECYYKQQNRQHPKSVAKGVISMLHDGENGSIWISKDCKFFKIVLPNLDNLKPAKKKEEQAKDELNDKPEEKAIKAVPDKSTKKESRASKRSDKSSSTDAKVRSGRTGKCGKTETKGSQPSKKPEKSSKSKPSDTKIRPGRAGKSCKADKKDPQSSKQHKKSSNVSDTNAKLKSSKVKVRSRSRQPKKSTPETESRLFAEEIETPKMSKIQLLLEKRFDTSKQKELWSKAASAEQTDVEESQKTSELPKSKVDEEQLEKVQVCIPKKLKSARWLFYKTTQKQIDDEKRKRNVIQKVDSFKNTRKTVTSEMVKGSDKPASKGGTLQNKNSAIKIIVVSKENVKTAEKRDASRDDSRVSPKNEKIKMKAPKQEAVKSDDNKTSSTIKPKENIESFFNLVTTKLLEEESKRNNTSGDQAKCNTCKEPINLQTPSEFTQSKSNSTSKEVPLDQSEKSCEIQPDITISEYCKSLEEATKTQEANVAEISKILKSIKEADSKKLETFIKIKPCKISALGDEPLTKVSITKDGKTTVWTPKSTDPFLVKISTEASTDTAAKDETPIKTSPTTSTPVDPDKNVASTKTTSVKSGTKETTSANYLGPIKKNKNDPGKKSLSTKSPTGPIPPDKKEPPKEESSKKSSLPDKTGVCSQPAKPAAPKKKYKRPRPCSDPHFVKGNVCPRIKLCKAIDDPIEEAPNKKLETSQINQSLKTTNIQGPDASKGKPTKK